MERAELEGLDRESLVVRAERAGIKRARILTRPELVDELLRLDPSADRAKLESARGFFGRARDLLARVVERGLHLPDAAERLRDIALGGPLPATVPRADAQAVPTVTLAEIYAAQGHKQRALETVRRVLEREPEHAAARALLARLEDVTYIAPPPPLPPEPEIEPEPIGEDEETEDIEAAVETTEVDIPTPEAVTEEIPALEKLAPPVAPPSPPASECVAVPIDAATTCIWWRASRSAPRGRLVVRAVVITPSWDGPATETRDLEVEPGEGAVVLRDLPHPAIVRAAVGLVDERGRFVPVASSPALEPARRAASGLARWTLRGFVPFTATDPRAASVARAVEAARRA